MPTTLPLVHLLPNGLVFVFAGVVSPLSSPGLPLVSPPPPFLYPWYTAPQHNPPRQCW